MQPRRILYSVEPLCKENEHSHINRRFLRTLLNLGDFENILFYAEKQHLGKVLEGLNLVEGRITVGTEIKIRLNKTPISILINIVKLLVISWKARRSAWPVIVLSCNKFLLCIIKFVSMVSRKPFIIVLHGFISELENNKKKILSVKWALSFGCNFIPITYLANGEHVLNNLIAKVPEIKCKTHVINLPVEENYIGESNVVSRGKKIVIGSAGVACQTKGSDKFFWLAKQFNNDDHLQFCYIGSVKNVPRTILNGVDSNLKIHGEKVSDLQYDGLFSQLDLLVLFYPVDSYRFGFSGVFLDAIRFCKPIVALKNDLFVFYFKKYGAMGWLFDDVLGINRFIQQIRQDNVVFEYVAAVNNMRNARVDFSLSVVASSLSSKINIK